MPEDFNSRELQAHVCHAHFIRGAWPQQTT
jgi:hypothetical protein